jgi:hypothetical protein
MIKLEPTSTNIVIMLILAVAIIIGAPLALIWALNTLFPVLVIPYTLETWLAAFIVPAAFRATVNVKGK